ncbi:MAG: hypothetical protein J0I77_09290 [Rudaea sp.]|uniref:hypothetical protein n=1 Tax=Rudaea sp. TaxID=2136325 RepID=UPI001AD084BE|nr:hypothetical protein [Rudaea sp.]MBN8885900.1 hypothetical protein [Rudaea sp.]
MSRRYAILDVTTLPAQLELQQGGLVLTYDTDGTSSDRNARATQSLSGSRWTWECAAWGTEALTATNVAFGLVKSNVASNVRVGNAVGSVGFTPGDGGIWVDGSKIDTIPTIGKQTYIQFALDLVAATPTLQIRVGNLMLYTFNLPAGQSWRPAASIGGATAYGLNALVNFGKRACEYVPPTNYKPGVFINSQSSGAWFFASQAHRNAPTGSPPNQRFAGCILEAEKVYFDGGIQVWTDGTSGSSWSASDVDLDNENGKLTPLFLEQPRNALVIWETLDLDNPDDPPTRVETTRVDLVTIPKRGVIRIKQRSPLAIYDDPWMRKTIPPWADSGSANQPWPIALGAVRNAEPVLLDPNGGRPIYAIHDAALTMIGIERDRGDPYNPAADPPDYTPTNDLRGTVLERQPLGPFVVDVSSTGSSNLTPTNPTELLGGVGAMTTASGAMPASWTDRAPAGSLCTVTQAWTGDGGGRLRLTMSAWQGQAFNMANASNASTPVAIVSGKRYRIALDVARFTKTTALARAILSVKLVDSGGVYRTLPGAQWGSFDIGHYTADFTAPIDAVALGVSAYIEVQPSTVSDTFIIDFDNVTLFQLPSAPGANVALEGISLANYMQEILENRFGAKSTEWVRADAEAIDAAKPYPFGVYIRDVVTTMAAIRAPLDSFCAAVTTDEYGRMRIVTLQDPDAMTPAMTVTFARAADAPLGDPDEAKGLTLNAGGRYNWKVHGDSDFVLDFNPATGIDAATRAKFKRQCQFLVKSSANLPDLYSFAENAKELWTLLDIPAHVQTQHDSVCGLFADARFDYPVTFTYAWPPAPILRPGLALRVICDSGAFTAGKNLYIKQRRHYPLPCRYEISVGWG